MLKKNLNKINLYLITNSKLTRKSVIDDAKAAVKAGVKIIQYREKEKSTKEDLLKKFFSALSGTATPEDIGNLIEELQSFKRGETKKTFLNKSRFYRTSSPNYDLISEQEEKRLRDKIRNLEEALEKEREEKEKIKREFNNTKKEFEEFKSKHALTVLNLRKALKIKANSKK